VILDADSEELALTSIYAGVKRPSSESYSTVVRSELRNVDKRGSASSAITAANVLDEDFMSNLFSHDGGYRILKEIRTSSAHWEDGKKKVMATIRQFSWPTFFITLSGAETRWAEIIVLLKRNVDMVEINEEEALNLQFREKARLIRTDPLTCARYFDYRCREVLKLMKKPGGIFGSNFVITYYWRVEFQQRGSPHIHGMFWVKDAPEGDFKNEESMPSVIAFIDQFVTVDVTNTDLASYVEKVRGQSVCRFGISCPPMPQTEILKPLPEETQNFYLHYENFKKMRSFLLRDQSDDLPQLRGLLICY